jgi:hypothetical protein
MELFRSFQYGSKANILVRRAEDLRAAGGRRSLRPCESTIQGAMATGSCLSENLTDMVTRQVGVFLCVTGY